MQTRFTFYEQLLLLLLLRLLLCVVTVRGKKAGSKGKEELFNGYKCDFFAVAFLYRAN